MRVAVAVVLLAGALAGCDAPVTPAPAAGVSEAANAAAMKQAGERECAELTNYSPEALKTKSAEMQMLVTRAFKSCVEAVMRGEGAGPGGGS